MTLHFVVSINYKEPTKAGCSPAALESLSLSLSHSFIHLLTLSVFVFAFVHSRLRETNSLYANKTVVSLEFINTEVNSIGNDNTWLGKSNGDLQQKQEPEEGKKKFGNFKPVCTQKWFDGNQFDK